MTETERNEWLYKGLVLGNSLTILNNIYIPVYFIIYPYILFYNYLSLLTTTPFDTHPITTTATISIIIIIIM